ncbi:MAG: OmpA family protein [Gemmatimonadota bacterium]
MGRLITLLIGLLLLAALIALCIGRGAPAIQADVLACARSNLEDAGLPGVMAAVDGRDVTLTGSAPDEAARSRAQAVVSENCGARVVVDQMASAPSGPYTTSLCIGPGGVEMSGSVPDPQARGVVQSVVEERVGDVPMASDLGIRAGPPQGYLRFIQEASSELPQLDEGCITLEDDQVRVEGRIRSEIARDRLVDELEGAAQQDFDVTFDLAVPELSEAARACQVIYNEMLAPGEQVLFDFDSTELHEEGRALLETVEQVWEQCPEVAVVVTGHTDSVGEAAYNRDLSQRRAEAVVEYLVGLGFDPAKLSAVGYGEAQPKASNETEEGRAMNRRIEFRVRETLE